MHSSSAFTTHLLQGCLLAGKSDQCHSSCPRSSVGRFPVLCQAQSAQRSRQKVADAPSLNLKELEQALSQDSGRSKRSTADDRIVLVDSSSSPRRDSNHKRQAGKSRQTRSASPGPVRQKGSKRGKPSNDSTERLSKVKLMLSERSQAP